MTLNPVVIGAIRGAKKELGHLVVPVIIGQEITIGRAKTNTIVVDSELVSRTHCRIYLLATSEDHHMVYVEDFSRGGTFLNGVRIGKGNHRALYPGCILTMALPTIPFSFIRMGTDWTETTTMNLTCGQVKISDEMIGSGSQSKVYLVANEFPCRHQFVCRRTRKQKLFGGDRRLHELQLKNELELLQTFHHPNIIQLIDYTIHSDNTVSMFFPLVCGGSLEVLLKGRNMLLAEQQVQFIMYQLFSGTKYLHGNRIIHRDLKPSNILVYKTGHAYPRIIITDFGLSIQMDKEQLWSHSDGTKSYFAPELAKDDTSCDPFDTKVDCWSLGLILHQLLTRYLPFELDAEYKQESINVDDHGLWKLQRQWILYGQVNINLPLISSQAISLTCHLLEKEPSQRWSSQQAFESPFIQDGLAKPWFLDAHNRMMDSFMMDSSVQMEDDLMMPSKSLLPTPKVSIANPIPFPGDQAQRQAFYMTINQ
ncbi:kinase-like domain-containing protein [Halteromyces radiatus]|uniref:kinase-like domain-containing protein n=1 Tax=Halteromyces radiatus TaxID=101107 RepID=UPI00221EF26B|nr:kinase-like domain-containing protein [Halteromyces radiatus]KAI8080057.1 kinase-like domain-containing protein [Halteromyces radiatus]